MIKNRSAITTPIFALVKNTCMKKLWTISTISKSKKTTKINMKGTYFNVPLIIKLEIKWIMKYVIKYLRNQVKLYVKIFIPIIDMLSLILC
jgi:hypothetical protein